jgi:GT2 family glycosyltransferase
VKIGGRRPSFLESPNVGAASGMRFASEPRGVKALQLYVAKKYRGEANLSSWLRTRRNAAFTLGSTLDNTIYKTLAVRAVGGFPKIKVNAGVDTTLAYRLRQAGYSWVVDYDVQSVHLRGGLMHELRHQYWYGMQTREIWQRITNEPLERSRPFRSLGFFIGSLFPLSRGYLWLLRRRSLQ